MLLDVLASKLIIPLAGYNVNNKFISKGSFSWISSNALLTPALTTTNHKENSQKPSESIIYNGQTTKGERTRYRQDTLSPSANTTAYPQTTFWDCPGASAGPDKKTPRHSYENALRRASGMAGYLYCFYYSTRPVDGSIGSPSAPLRSTDGEPKGRRRYRCLGHRLTNHQRLQGTSARPTSWSTPHRGRTPLLPFGHRLIFKGRKINLHHSLQHKNYSVAFGAYPAAYGSVQKSAEVKGRLPQTFTLSHRLHGAPT